MHDSEYTPLSRTSPASLPMAAFTSVHPFVLIGTGSGVWATARQSRAIDGIIRANRGEAHILHGCDAQGRIRWRRASQPVA